MLSALSSIWVHLFSLLAVRGYLVGRFLTCPVRVPYADWNAFVYLVGVDLALSSRLIMWNESYSHCQLHMILKL